MKKIIITSIIILASLVAIGFVLTSNKKENQEKIDTVAATNAAVAVKVAQIKTEEVSFDFETNGTFEPIQQLTFSAEKSGKITNVLVKEGDYVRAGQVLAIMRGDAIGVSAENANAVYQNAVVDYNRFENAYKTGGVTKQQLDQAKVNMLNAKANLSQANINVGDTRIKAPFSGFINKKFIEVGSIITSMPATELFEIVNTAKLKLNVTVNENQVTQLKVGTPIKVKSSVFPDKTFNGKITFIAAMADASLNFPVEIEINNNASNDLKAGMYGTAEFTSNQQKQNIMIAPRAAFVGSVSSNQVFVNENGTAVLKNVTSGRIVGDRVEIISGLKDGDVVVTTGQINLADGAKIEVIK
ncbi:efflux RND transporter periplasmic adaptor subunit [Flavobacterium sp.]|uniref:efflux RND transporter periplasmic adaptor subunit n=1 Tax=Flavobacterium sp. TaxID=239 RepID=UPI0028BD80C6|nr:efflux RND transporter periplasmic adaptor subunit [Flavobacterium sp.]